MKRARAGEPCYGAPMLRPTFIIVVLAPALLAASSALAMEGKWLPEQVPLLDQSMLQKEGLKLPAQRLWDPKRGTGLLAGAINLNGCSGAFISNTGLVLTNHHCVFSLVAEHTTPTRNLLEDGFLAKSPAEELPGKAMRLRVPRSFNDVTAEVLAAVPAGADDLTRFGAVDKKGKELVAVCEQQPNTRCELASHWGGVKYVLMEQTEFTDVRLVYAPPRAVGEYGGEIDNWMWPRHSGDFAIVRAYAGPDGAPAAHAANNAALRPEFFFPISTQGVQPGDFVMVLGYPGYTVREQLREEMAFRAERFFPWFIGFGTELIDVLEGVSDPAGRIAVASQLKSLHNRRKNAQGQIAGIARGEIIDKKGQQDQAVLAFAAKHKDHAQAATAHQGLLAELIGRQESFAKDALLGQVFYSSRALAMAVRVARMQSEQQKPDLERDPGYMARERPRLLSELEREQKNLFVPADKELLFAFVKRAQALPPAKRIAAIDKAIGKATTDRALKNAIDRLYARTKVTDPRVRAAMTEEDPKALAKRKDPLLDLALGLNDALDTLKREEDRRQGASLRLRPVWMQAVMAHAGKPVAPDANRTLRVSFARVRGYSPRDGVSYHPRTTLAGKFEKQTGREPFVIPMRIQQAVVRRDFGRFYDKKLGDVPVNFLSDADTTGGNSGSPVVNGKGELVGVNFDRVWENVANDFGYNPAIARNVSVEVRYLLWLLDKVEGASALLAELGVQPG
jgi:hypothetical protein